MFYCLQIAVLLCNRVYKNKRNCLKRTKQAFESGKVDSRRLFKKKV